MKLLQNFTKNTRHVVLLLGLFMALGITSCEKEESIMDPDQPVANDDASLLKWQMEKRIKTRAGESYNAAIVTTKGTFVFTELIAYGDFSIDWGDGTRDSYTGSGKVVDISHKYTDGLPAHTIFLYNDVFKYLNVGLQEIIFIDISRCLNLKELHVASNRLTNIDVTKNINLENLNIFVNNISNIDLSNNTKLTYITAHYNPISKIDASVFPELLYLGLSHSQIDTINVSNNSKLEHLAVTNTKVKSVDVSNCPNLLSIECGMCLINNLDLSNNPKLQVIYCHITNITELDLSIHSNLETLMFPGSKINNIILPDHIDNLRTIFMKNTPIEQNMRKMMNIALSLPDRTGLSIAGRFSTSTPYLSTIEPMLTEYNWIIE